MHAEIGLLCERSAQFDRAVRIPQHQPAMSQIRHLREQALAQETIQRTAIAACIVEFVFHNGVHGDLKVVADGGCGRVYTGLRFSHSRSACQWIAPTTCAVING